MLYNFIYYFLFTLYIVSCFLLIALILIQKGKSGMGIGTMGGGTQMLFGGSGGQDFFQKLTWVLGVILMAGSLILGLIKSSTLYNVKYMPVAQPAQSHELTTQPLADELEAKPVEGTSEVPPAAEA